MKNIKYFSIKVIIILLIISIKTSGGVWVIDDGEKIKRDSTSLPFELGIQNPIWSPGNPVKLFALKNETISFQVVIDADEKDLNSVTVDLDILNGPDGSVIQNTSSDPTQFVGRYIERFVEHYFNIDRKSGGPWKETLYWGSGAEPKDGAWTGWMPDALIPVEVAPEWSPYPLKISKGTNGVVWIDITIPKEQKAGIYTGEIVVKNNNNLIKKLDVEIKIYDEVLPDWPLKSMYYYDYEELAKKFGISSDAAEKHLWQLFHRHRITPFYNVLNVSDVNHILSKLHGTVYNKENGYEGPAENKGDDLLSLGTYATFGEPDASGLANIEAIADKLASEDLFSSTDVFVYAKDEDCESTWGEDWKNLLKGSSNINIKNVAVGWTCSTTPKDQPVDIVMSLSAEYDFKKTEDAVNKGKKVWIYNGFIPKTGAYVTDLEAISPRVNGLIQAYYGIERWFYWETTFWYDWNNGGWGDFDPFFESETYHNQWNEYANGDGVLVYPGKQVNNFTEHSIGMNGIIASIRLKNIRRGIQDAGYYELAYQKSPEKAREVVGNLIHPAISFVSKFFPQTWSYNGIDFYNVRDSLKNLIFSTTAVRNNSSSHLHLKNSFKLENVFPNPFNISTNIKYQLNDTGKVKLTVYNALGMKMERLVDEIENAGSYSINWDASKYSSGVYFIRMKADNAERTIKVILNK